MTKLQIVAGRPVTLDQQARENEGLDADGYYSRKSMHESCAIAAFCFIGLGIFALVMGMVAIISTLYSYTL